MSDQDQTMMSKAAEMSREHGGVLGQVGGAAAGLGDILSKPAGSQERATAAQEQLKATMGQVPIVGDMAADWLIGKINDQYGPKGSSVTEGDGMTVDGSVAGPGAGIRPDGGIDTGNGEAVSGSGNVSATGMSKEQIEKELTRTDMGAD